MGFVEQVVLISAACCGIGRATAEIMMREGAVVVGVDNDDGITVLYEFYIAAQAAKLAHDAIGKGE